MGFYGQYLKLNCLTVWHQAGSKQYKYTDIILSQKYHLSLTTANPPSMRYANTIEGQTGRGKRQLFSKIITVYYAFKFAEIHINCQNVLAVNASDRSKFLHMS